VRLLVLLAAAAVATPFAAAALTSVAGGAVGSGSAAVAPCDSDGFGAAYTTSGGGITAVTVTGIADPDCEGAVARVAIVDASGAAIGTGGPETVAADGDAVDNAATVPVTDLPALLDARRVEVVLEGP
jgi:hypothetical protein